MPCTYYGTEIGMDGVYDPGCRKAFIWNKDGWNKELYSYYKKLISIRGKEMPFRYGEVEFIYNNDVFAMKRIYKDDVIYVLINNTDEMQSVNLGTERKDMYDILNETEIKSNLGKVNVLPKTAHYIKRKEGKWNEKIS